MDIDKVMEDARDAETIDELWRVHADHLDLDPDAPTTREVLASLKCAFYSGATAAVILIENARLTESSDKAQCRQMRLAIEDVIAASLRLAQPVM